MRLNSRLALVGAVSVLALALNPAAALAHDGGGHNLVRADFTPSLPTDPAINGVKPGGAPWIIDKGTVRVRDDGRIKVRIEGLQVLRPTGLADNPVPNITASLYCDGATTAAAVSTLQPMTVPDGDARFSETLMNAPENCGAATVLINPNGAAGTFIASAMGTDGDDD
jgi:hypothetical protein